MRGVAAERSAQRACERSSDWRRGARSAPPTRRSSRTKSALPRPGEAAARKARSPDPEKQPHEKRAPPTRSSSLMKAFGSRPELFAGQTRACDERAQLGPADVRIAPATDATV